MPLFQGHRDEGIQRFFIELPDDHKHSVAYKYPDDQIRKYSVVNVDADYLAVFVNLGKVIGTLPPGRHNLDEGATLGLAWLVDRLTGDAYYDTELFYVTTRDLVGIEFGGPVDNVTDTPTGLVVSLRVFGELAFKVANPEKLIVTLTGTGVVGGFDPVIEEWVKDQALAGVRTVVPRVVAGHGVLAMGELQDATAAGALAHANEHLDDYGLCVTDFAQLNVNLSDEDTNQLKTLARTRAFTGVAGNFSDAVKGQATLAIADGVAAGNVGAEPAIIAGMLLGTANMGGLAPSGASTGTASTPPSASPCGQCGTALPLGARFCPNCGTAQGAGAEPTAAP